MAIAPAEFPLKLVGPPIPRPLVVAFGVATLVIFVIGVFAGWWDFLKIYLVDGPFLGIPVARHIGWRGGISTIFASAIGGFLALGSLGFFAVLFPGPPQAGFVNWGGRHPVAAIYLFAMGGLLGGCVGALAGLLAATVGWLSANRKACDINGPA